MRTDGCWMCRVSVVIHDRSSSTNHLRLLEQHIHLHHARFPFVKNHTIDTPSIVRFSTMRKLLHRCCRTNRSDHTLIYASHAMCRVLQYMADPGGYYAMNSLSLLFLPWSYHNSLTAANLIQFQKSIGIGVPQCKFCIAIIAQDSRPVVSCYAIYTNSTAP